MRGEWNGKGPAVSLFLPGQGFRVERLLHLLEVFVDELDHHRALAHGGGDALDVAAAHVADGMTWAKAKEQAASQAVTCQSLPTPLRLPM